MQSSPSPSSLEATHDPLTTPPPRRALPLHPSIVAARARTKPTPPGPIALEEIRALALAAGADDAGIVSLDHPDLLGERPYALTALPTARSFIALVQRTHRENIRSPKRSVANHEFHRVGHAIDAIAARLTQVLTERGYAALHPPMAFPMEMGDFPGRTWIVSHKQVAVAARLGKMGLHRNVIHPEFGSFILFGTVLTSAEVLGERPALDFDPCISCKLCVAACPVGAIEPDGQFRFSACNDHNYREFMTGFSDFVEQIADSNGPAEYREKVTLSETVSMWQSLAYGPNYKAAYCIVVCPAGSDVLGPFVDGRAQYLQDVVRPLTDKVETVYAVEGSDAALHVQKRFPHKRLRLVRSSLRAKDARGFFFGLRLLFQRAPARGWAGTFHFELTQESERAPFLATVRIDDGTLAVTPGELVGQPDVTVRTAEALWLDIVSKKKSPVWAVLTGRLSIRGKRELLGRFQRCFPR